MRVCLRCDWTGGATGDCPRCGAPLYRTRTERPGRGVEADGPDRPRPAGDPEGSRGEDREPPEDAEDPLAGTTDGPAGTRGRGTWPVRHRAVAAAVVVGLALTAATVATRRNEPPPRPAPPEPGAEREDRAQIRFLALPESLSDLTFGDPLRIAFVAQAPERPDRQRIWRLELPTGTLTPGPLVGPVARIEYQPSGHGRLALLEEDTTLSVVDPGVLGAAPAFIDAGVDAMGHGGPTLGYASYTDRSDGDGPASVHVGTLRNDDRLEVRERPLGDRVQAVLGVQVRGGRAYVWGPGAGGTVLQEISTRSSAQSHDLGDREVIDISPAGLVVAASHEAGLELVDLEAGDSRLVGVRELGRYLAWRPGEGSFAAVSRIGGLLFVRPTGRNRAEVSELPATVSPGPLPGRVGFSPDGEWFVWTGGDALALVRPDAGDIYQIEIPASVGRLTGPVTIG